MHKHLASLFITGLLLTSVAFAGPGLPGHRHLHEHQDVRAHDGPIDEEHAREMAHEVVTKLANLRKIDSSWIRVDAKKAEKKQYPSGLEWVVRFNNPDLAAKAKQNLYVFLTLSGKYIAANYTGN